MTPTSTSAAGWPPAHPPGSPIPTGGLFPVCESPAEATFDELSESQWGKGNHPSFRRAFGEGSPPPGLEILDGYFKKGYVERFESMSEAEARHGSLIVSPLGLVSRLKSDSLWKHRIIHDLRRGGPNTIAACFERVVLPRPSDHAWDLFELREAAYDTYGDDDDAVLYTLICDFKDAFTTSRSTLGSRSLRWPSFQTRRLPADRSFTSGAP